ncbi:MAG TPA: ATPase domain-containing protein [archaeon]|nr:ATPase domain-containing protein [archaeon]
MATAVFYVLDPRKYEDGQISVLKGIKSKNIVYVTVNKPYSHLESVLKRRGIDAGNIFFIDCISRYSGISIKEGGRCIFVSNPQDLTAISIAISVALKNMSGEKAVVLDSVNTLRTFNEDQVVGRFLNFLINRMRALDVYTVLFELEAPLNEMIRQTESIADRVEVVR